MILFCRHQGTMKQMIASSLLRFSSPALHRAQRKERSIYSFIQGRVLCNRFDSFDFWLDDVFGNILTTKRARSTAGSFFLICEWDPSGFQETLMLFSSLFGLFCLCGSSSFSSLLVSSSLFSLQGCLAALSLFSRCGSS